MRVHPVGILTRQCIFFFLGVLFAFDERERDERKTQRSERESLGERGRERERERERESLCSEHGMHKVRVAEEP